MLTANNCAEELSLRDLFTMFELFSIKQEPELNILPDGEGDELSDTSTSIVVDNDKSKLRLTGCKNDRESMSFKLEATEANSDWINFDNTKTLSFQCYMCSKTYTTKQMLQMHIDSIHMLLRPFKCALCLRSFANKYSLTTHSRIHSGERPYACPFCEKTFARHSAMTQHKRIHTKEKPYQCEMCSKAFSDRSSFNRHRKLHTSKTIRKISFRCEICNASFITNSQLVRHNKTKSHLKPELGILPDGEGDEFSVTSTSSVVDNDKSKLRLTGCKNDRESMSFKLATDNKSDWIKCDNKKIRSFQCYMCWKAYRSKQMLKLHINSIHMLLRPFKCALCLRSFANKYSLTTHSRVHSGERPYACPFCEKTFVQHAAVTKHKRIHTKEKPYQCEMCSKAFNDSSSLNRHRKLHTGKTIQKISFRCEICNASFINNSQLVRHNTTKSHLKRVIKCKGPQSIITPEVSLSL